MALGAPKSFKNNSAPSLSLRLLSIVASGERGGHWGGGGGEGAPIFSKYNSAPFLRH